MAVKKTSKKKAQKKEVKKRIRNRAKVTCSRGRIYSITQ